MKIEFIENRYKSTIHYVMSHGNDTYVPRIGETVSMGSAPTYVVESIHFDILNNHLYVYLDEEQKMKCSKCGKKLLWGGFERKLITRGKDKGRSEIVNYFKPCDCKGAIK